MCTFRQLRCAVVLCVCLHVCHAGGANPAFAGSPEGQRTRPTPPPYSVDRSAIEADMGTGGAAALGIPLCETTGFEANEPTCNWEAGYGICGSTFTCKNTATDGPYPTTCAPPLTQPDNCCVNAPNPNTGRYMSASSQHCQQPSISTANPLTGTQALHFERSTLGGNPAGCVGFPTTGACRLSAFTLNANPGSPGTLFNPGITITSFDVSRDVGIAHRGMEIEWSNQSNSEGLLAQLIIFSDFGYVVAYDFALNAYGYIGALHQGGQWHHIETVHDICGDSVRYYFDGVLEYEAFWSSGTTQHVQSIEQSVWLANNRPGAIFDFDNFSVSRDLEPELTCPHVCGDGTLDDRYEECEPGIDESCCPGHCGAIGSPAACQCSDPQNTIFTCTPREVFNGNNGPFFTDGGFYSYTADAPFTSVDTCASDFDSQIFWNLTPDCEQYEAFNDDCWEDDYDGGQQPGDPNAVCFGGAYPNYQSCICNPTVPGTTYTFLIAEWAPAAQGGTTLIPPFCSSTVVEITKKTSCELGGTIEGGACCDRLTGTCTDGLAAIECTGTHDVYSVNKLCSMVACEPITGGCCNRAPGAGGACVETPQAECPPSPYTFWLAEAACGTFNCLEVTGSCCNELTGQCTADLTQTQCSSAPDHTWTEAGGCDDTCTASRSAPAASSPAMTRNAATDTR